MVNMIKKRKFFHIGGYDPIGVEARYRRFKRDLAVFEGVWGVKAEVTALNKAPDNSRAWWSVKTEGPNWRVETDYELLLWDDILMRDSARSSLSRLVLWVFAFGNFLFSGTVFRYFRANWPYAAFFLFPAICLLLFGYLGVLAGRWGTSYVGIDSVAAVIVVAVAVFFLLLRWPGRWWRVEQALDDWIFARELLRGERRDVDERVEIFANSLISSARNSSFDEIVVLGHSLGGSLAIDMTARALVEVPELGRERPNVALLTVGSTMPKFALHPAGVDLREKIARLVAATQILWADYQSRHDFISFYRVDPVTLKRGLIHRTNTRPVIKVIGIPDMLKPETLLRYRVRFLRLHYQYVLANERRAHFDYFMLLGGPVPVSRFVAATHGFLELLAADTSYADEPAALHAPAV